MKILILFASILVASNVCQAQNVGIGVTSPQARLHVEGDPASLQSGIRSHINFSGPIDISAVFGESIPEFGYGVGGTFQAGFIGVSATAFGNSYTGTTYGIYGSSTGDGSSGTRIGVYGDAYGGATNWAGWFQGDTKVTADLKVDQDISAEYAVINTQVTTPQIYHSPDLHLLAGIDMELRIGDVSNDPTSVFRIRNGLSEELFAVDVNGNARTYGTHYVDGNLGVGTLAPATKLHVQDGSVRIQGFFPTLDINTTNTSLPCGIGFQEFGVVEGAVYYDALNNRLNMTNNIFNPGIVMDLISNAVSIGEFDNAAGYKLSVNGKVTCEELKVEDSGVWPDYVFDPSYPLMPLPEVEAVIRRERHLPGIPSAAEVEQKGILIGDMHCKMMEKIEELTLYIISQEKRITALEAQLQQN